MYCRKWKQHLPGFMAGILLVLIVSSVFLLLSGQSLQARPNFERTWMENRVRAAFFESLTEQQRLQLITDLERANNYSRRDLGALYRWGYVPVDREPPASLGQWWQAQTNREQDRLRLAWFRRNYQRLNPDNAARILGLQSRLYRIHQEYEFQWERRPDALEEVELSLETTPEEPQPAAPDEDKVDSPSAAEESRKAGPRPETQPVEETVPSTEPVVPPDSEPTEEESEPLEAGEPELDSEVEQPETAAVERETDSPVHSVEVDNLDSNSPQTMINHPRRRVYWSDNGNVRVMESLRMDEPAPSSQTVTRERQYFELRAAPPIIGTDDPSPATVSPPARPGSAPPADTINFSPPPIR